MAPGLVGLVWFSGLGPFLVCLVVLFLGVFCLFGWVRLCPFSPSSSSVSLLSMMTWAPCPHAVRTRGKKRDSRHWQKRKHCSCAMGSSEPNACEQWLTEVTRDLFKPIPFREVFVILALFLPQLTFAEGAKLDCKLWYSPAISNELTTVHVTPIAQGLQGMREYKIAFAPNSRAAAFVSPEQPAQKFESLATLPSEQIHIGSQVRRVYRLVLREGSQVFALLVVLLEYVTPLCTVALPEHLHSIGHRAFAECRKLVCLTHRSTKAGQHCIQVAANAFEGCQALTVPGGICVMSVRRSRCSQNCMSEKEY